MSDCSNLRVDPATQQMLRYSGTEWEPIQGAVLPGNRVTVVWSPTGDPDDVRLIEDTELEYEPDGGFYWVSDSRDHDQPIIIGENAVAMHWASDTATALRLKQEQLNLAASQTYRQLMMEHDMEDV